MIHSLLFLFLRTQQDYRRKAGRVHHHRTIAGLIFPNHSAKFGTYCALILHRKKKIYLFLKKYLLFDYLCFQKSFIVQSNVMSRHKNTKIHFLITS